MIVMFRHFIIFYQIYSSNEFANQTDGVEYEFKTNDSSEFNMIGLQWHVCY